MNPRLPQSLLEELLPNLALQFAPVPDGESTLPALTSLHIQRVGGAHAATWQPTRLCSMTLTLGSTGLPRTAVHTYQTHLASAKGVLSSIPFDDYDDWLLSLPLLHVSSQGVMWCQSYAGVRMTVRDKQPLEQMLAGYTHASLVPTQLRRLLVSHSSVSLKAVLFGGAAIPARLTEQTREQGIRCFRDYGLTEFASTVCVKEVDGLVDVGSPLPGQEVKIVNNEVRLRAVNMAEGYWYNRQLVSLVNDGGWYVTRDRGEIYSGKLIIVGRSDNLFFSGGEGTQPEGVERVIAAHPAVLQVSIVPVVDKEFDHRPVAAMEHDHESVDPSEWVKDKLAGFQQPVRRLTLSPELKNGGIRISRQVLKEWV